MRPKAEIIHYGKQRLRLRFSDHKKDTEFFEKLSQQLAQFSTVDELRWSPITGSLLVQHHDSNENLLSQAKELDLFEVYPHDSRHLPLRNRLKKRFGRMDDAVSRYTGGEIDMAYLGMLGLAGAAVYQATRGKLLPAGMTLLMYSYGLMSDQMEHGE